MSSETMFARFQVSEQRLPNGLRVLVREDHSAPVVAIFTHVLAGYFDEPDDWVGISHVLEHMYFKGTPTREPGAIARQTKEAGGYLNASTIYDHTIYYTVLPSAALQEGIEIQADALTNSLIDEEELRRELQVIIQEAKRKLDNPSAVARESLFELLFDRHRIRRWRIGTQAGLSRLTRADVVAFFKTYYTAGAIVLVVAGDVDTAEVVRAVEQKYRNLPGGGPRRDRGPTELDRRIFRFRSLSGDVLQTQIEIGWRTRPTLHADTPYLDLAAIIAGQGRASRLYRNVRDSGLATAISAHNYTPTEVGVFTVSAEAEPSHAVGALRAIMRAMRELRAGVVAAELQRAKNLLEARMLRTLETIEGQASFLAEWEALGDWRFGPEYFQTVMSADLSDITRVVQQYLSPDAAAVLVHQPSTAPVVAENEMQAYELLNTDV